MAGARARIRVKVLGPVQLEVDGAAVRLTPLTVRLLVRLVAAEGEAVPVRQLRRDVWGLADEPRHLDQRNRNEVQKRVLELRRVLAPGDRSGAGSSGAHVLRTEQQVTAQGSETAYRLVLRPEELDSSRFTAIVSEALLAPPATAAHQLAEALSLVRGRPLAEVNGEGFATSFIRRLTALQNTARRELVRVQTDLGRPELALPVAELIAHEHPDDVEAARALDALRAELRARHGDELLRHRVPLPGRRAEVVLIRGDLFDQVDANLVVGFSDTFDTENSEDLVISRESVQSQLVDRVFAGRRRLLDGKLRAGLRTVKAVGTENVRSKPLGRRVRYPVGTTVMLPVDGRRVFATAYSRLGNDLVARSNCEDLRRSLDNVWAAVAVHGLFKPVAVPLIGSGLARITDLDRGQLVALIVDSFIDACREHPALAPELRIVVRPQELARTDLTPVERRFQETVPGLHATD
ncbi:macro domain-containing protein [Streptomyces beihaiensis]|uniref:Bacterial transcriptional activator domain-containing protein n=1 Tax=Streptomyces beihaiensis TaxID=2984495 RepID=A0ABT3TUU9_9ACTN|nr:macro domain-containing protein [Streptomyces beihaiensis]MCX3059788.1 bacterial transcriptional activator domain-containing protein [Streptomyces beihaiensis]